MNLARVGQNLAQAAPFLQSHDALCCLTTGGALRTRKLYTGENEVIFDELRHVILNSIGDVVRQNDLRDRCLFIWQPHVSDPKAV